MGTGILFVFAVLTGSFSAQFIRLFRDDPEVVSIGAFALASRCITLPFSAFIVMSNMMFQYIGRPAKAAVLAMSRQGLVFIPIILVFARFFGLVGIQISQSVADGVTFLLAIPLTMGTLRILKAGKAQGEKREESIAFPDREEVLEDDAHVGNDSP